MRGVKIYSFLAFKNEFSVGWWRELGGGIILAGC